MADARHCGAYARVDDSYDGWTRPSAEQVTGRPAKVRTRHFFRIPSQLEMEPAPSDPLRTPFSLSWEFLNKAGSGPVKDDRFDFF